MAPPAELVAPGVLTLGACVVDAPPIHIVGADGEHGGYEGEIARAIAADLGLQLRWQILDWPDLYPALDEARIDAVLYNQAVLPQRKTIVDFTVPYGLFHEALLVLTDSAVGGPSDLRGRRVGALAGTTNMTLAQAIAGAEVVSFDAATDGLEAMLSALRTEDVDAIVDDELFLEAFEADGFRIAFTVPTKNAYAIAVRKDSTLRTVLDGALARLLESALLEELWHRTIPAHPFERPEPQPERGVAELREIVERVAGRATLQDQSR